MIGLRVLAALPLLTAAAHARRPAASDYLPSCAAAEDVPACKDVQGEFRDAFAGALAGRYFDMVDVASFLKPPGSPSHAVRTDPIAACAWRIAAETMDARSPAPHEGLVQAYCGDLSPEERERATMLARGMLGRR